MEHARESFNDSLVGEDQQIVHKPWVAGKPTALAKDVLLPAPLQSQVKTTLIFKDKNSDLEQVAARIALATMLPVRVRPEALLPSHYFMPRLQGVDAAWVVRDKHVLPMPNGSYPLSRILDLVAAQHGVQWKYSSRGIEFYRTETRIFDIRALTLSAQGEMKLGKGSSSDVQGFQIAAQTTLTMEREPVLATIKQRLEPFMTRAGTISAQPGSMTTIVVTDTPEALEGIAAYLDTVNKTMSKRVRLVFEEMTVTQKQAHEQGVDWSLVFAKGMLAMGLGKGSSSTAPAVFQAGVGTSVGSASVAIRALSDYANVLRHTVVPVVTLNRRPVTHAVRSTFTYVDQIQALDVNQDKDKKGLGMPNVAVSQKQETTGAFLTLVPEVQEDGQILLTVAYDNTVAQPLKSLHFGNQDNQYQVQQLTLHGSGTVQQVALRPGYPVLVAGFEEREVQNDMSRLGPDMPKATGGLDKVSQQQRMTLIFVTAQVEEGF